MERYECDGTRARPFRSRRGLVLGVCRGLAEHWGISVFWTRVLVVALAVFTAFWPVVIAYTVLGLLLRPEPRYMMERAGERPARSRRAFEGIDQRLRHLEDVITSQRHDWEDRLERGL